MSIKRDEKQEWTSIVNLSLNRAKSLIGDGQLAFAVRDYKAANHEIAMACDELEKAFNAVSNLYAMHG